jgi:VanZ family protein
MIKRTLETLLERRYLIYFLFTLTTLAILYLTLVPSERLGQYRLFQYDKIGHFMMFFSWTMIFGLLSISKNRSKARLTPVFFAGALFGIAVEIAQGLMPFGRSIDLYDAIADILGTTTATLLLYLIKTYYLPPK